MRNILLFLWVKNRVFNYATSFSLSLSPNFICYVFLSCVMLVYFTKYKNIDRNMAKLENEMKKFQSL